MKASTLTWILALGAITLGLHPAHAAPPSAPAASASGRVDDAAVKKALEDEMARTLSQLKVGSEAPPYFVRYVVADSDRSWVSARLGALVEEEKQPGRTLHIEVRVGSADEDNTNFAGSSPGGSASVTRDDDYGVLRRDLWQLTDREYKQALEAIARKRASRAVQAAEKEKVPDFSKSPVVNTVTNKAIVPTDADRTKLKDLTLELSRVFREFPKVDNGRVSSGSEVTRRRLLTSEKTWTDERRSRVRIDVVADTIAEDGQHLNASLSFSADSLAGLPALEKMSADVRTLAKNLTEQRSAPQVEAGVASVLFEGQAAGQLARLLLASPFSGQPIPRSPGERMAIDGSSSFAEKMGLVVAPKWLNVVDDPTGLGPNKRLLGGGYDTDDEGVPAEKVTLIDKGVAKSLFMSRAPRKDHPTSNGHGRGAAAIRASASNLFVTATGGLSKSELLAAAVRSAGPKGSVYVVRQLSEASGIGRGQTIQARVAVRWKDGKEEPVRGLSLEGFALKKLKKDLVAAGKDPFVVEDYALSVVTPALLFEDVDVGRPNDKNRTPPLYPSPLATGSTTTR
ncbi:MAG: TldD-domain protein [Labilithrix sp.]|nr:TldD-domain protein [Labilithrix sp.]